MTDYLALNEHRTTDHSFDNVDPTSEGYSDGLNGEKPCKTLSRYPGYRQGYTKGIVELMKTINNRQRTYVDPSTGFDWF